MDWSNPQWDYYHYTRAEKLNVPRLEHVREQVMDRVVYFPRPSQLNDPLDCRPNLTAPTLAQLLEYRVRVGAKRFPGRNRRRSRSEAGMRMERRILNPEVRRGIWEKNAENWGILSLSRRRDNSYMWEMYADKGRGVCIEYDFEFIVDAGFGKWVFMEVRYSDQAPSMNILDYYRGGQVQATQFARSAFETKTVEWSREEEVRVLYPVGDLTPPKVRIPPHTIRALYLGPNISDADKDQILSWQAVIPIYQVVAEQGGVSFKPANYLSPTSA